MRRLYIAGPMSGMPLMNYPAFNDAAAQFRALGFEVENPAENPEPDCGTWLGWMRMAIPQVCRSDGVVLLPGWHNSRGARAEFRLATDIGIPAEPLEVALRRWRPADGGAAMREKLDRLERECCANWGKDGERSLFEVQERMGERREALLPAPRSGVRWLTFWRRAA